MVDSCPKEPSYLSQNSGFFYIKEGRGVAGCCKLLGAGILCSCSCPCPSRSGHNVHINLLDTHRPRDGGFHHKPNPRHHSESWGSTMEARPLLCPSGCGVGTAGDLRHGSPGQSQHQSSLPVELMLHLFFTNFFLEALGFNRLLPAPKVLSRTCKVADRLEMSFSAKGDTPAM